MVTSAELIELRQLLNSEFGDPHHILGMHSILFCNRKILTVRAFIPQAKKIDIFDPLIPDKIYPMEKVHSEGFFEGIIDDRDKWFRYMLRIESTDGNCWTCYDSYSFFPSINEMDKYLFFEGTHYEIYNKLGAHLTKLEDIPGAAFVVWAPNALRVSVIGEFNCWDGRRNQMRNLSGSGLWEIFIPGLQNLDGYKYEIKTKNGAFIQKCDPYGFYAAQSPNTQSHIYDIDRYEWNDDVWMTKRLSCEPLSLPINIYEVHLASWLRTENGNLMSYAQLADSLIEHVKNSGYNYIEFMPIQEHTNMGALGYQTTCYYAPTCRYGKPDELMYFIDKCHQESIGVIMDWVPTHFPHDHHALVKFDGSALYEHSDPRLGIHPVWGTNMFDYSRKEVKNFLLGNALFWIEKYHIDGLRINNLASILFLDYGRHGKDWLPNRTGGNANTEAIEFIKHLNSIVEKKHPNVLMIAEDTSGWGNVTKSVNDGGLGFGLVWNLGWMHNFLAYFTADYEHRIHYQDNLTHYFSNDEKSILTLSHDELAYNKVSIFNRIPGDTEQKFANLRLALVFMMGHPGKKLHFMGMEFGQINEWNINNGLDWHLQSDENHMKFSKFVKDINEFYLTDKALWEHDFGDGTKLSRLDDDVSGIISFIRSTDTDDITIFVCNFTRYSYESYIIDVPQCGDYIEKLNSDSKIYGGKNHINKILNAKKKNNESNNYILELKLPAFGASIIKLKKKTKKQNKVL